MCPPAKGNGVWPFNDAWLRTSLEEARRHATLPRSWIQRENWEFETHSPTAEFSCNNAVSNANFRQELAFLGMTPSLAFVRQSEGNGRIDRLRFRTPTQARQTLAVGR